MVTPIKVIEEAMSLPRSERSFIAERLLESLDEERDLSPEWRDEIARRLSRLDSGEAHVFSRGEIRQDARNLVSK